MSEFLITVLPLCLLGLAYYLIVRKWRERVPQSVHAGFIVMLAVLSVWGAYQLWVVFTGDGWSRLILLYWVFFGIPVAVGTFILVWSVTTLWQGWKDAGPEGRAASPWPRRVALVVVGLSFLMLLGYSYREHQLSLARNPQANPDTLHALYHSRYAQLDQEVVLLLARNQNTPEPVLMQLAEHENVSVRLTMCYLAKVPGDALPVLAQDQAWTVRVCVAGKSRVPAGLLKRLSEDPNGEVRRMVARNESTPEEALVRLEQDDTDRVREALAMNPAIPDGMVRRLASDRSDQVRRRVASHKNLPASLQLQLAGDSSKSVRWAVLYRAVLAREALHKLAQDPDPAIRDKALRRLEDSRRMG